MPTKRKIRHSWKRRDQGFWLPLKREPHEPSVLTQWSVHRTLEDFSVEELAEIEAKLMRWVAMGTRRQVRQPW